MNNVQNVLAGVLRAVQDGLNAPRVPIQKLLLEHILDMVHKSGVQFVDKVALVYVFKCGVDVEPPVHIVADNGLALKFIHA